jgi:hypothetical protein
MPRLAPISTQPSSRLPHAQTSQPNSTQKGQSLPDTTLKNPQVAAAAWLLLPSDRDAFKLPFPRTNSGGHTVETSLDMMADCIARFQNLYQADNDFRNAYDAAQAAIGAMQAIIKVQTIPARIPWQGDCRMSREHVAQIALMK